MVNKSTILLACCAVLAPLALAQEFRGTISGLVLDPSGAPVGAAKVSVVETKTGTRVETTSDAAGQYTAPFLLPGDYDVTAKFAGFKEYVRKGLHLDAGERMVIDIKLDVGDSSQTVTVTMDAPLINSENASVGQSITGKEVEDLPLNGGTPLTLAALSIGVLATAQPSTVNPFDSGGAAAWSIGGTASQTNEILVNGSPDSTWDGRLAYSPPRDAVREVAISAFQSDATFGHTGGGVLNQILKSGTNQLHGTLSEQNRPNATTSNNFFNNKAGLGNPVTHYNQFGATIGGPVVLPKIFNGKDKLFWFVGWESIRGSQPNTTFMTVPTAKQRTGDFSELLALGSAYQLYDPTSATLTGTTINRKAYPGNVIPASQISPIASALLKFYPLPNIAAQRTDGFNNFGNTSPTQDEYNNQLGRLDWNISSKHRLFFDVRHTDYFQSKNNYFNSFATGSNLTRENWGTSLDHVWTVTNSSVLNLRFNFTRMAEAHPSPSEGFDPTTLGFPGYLNSNSNYRQLPTLSFATNSGVQSIGTNGADAQPSQSTQLFLSFMMMKGKHTLKYGVDLRQYNLNVIRYGNSVGNYSFSANTWVRAASNASSTVVMGQDVAQLLLGLPTSGSFDINTSGAFFQHYMSGFVQDDWRVKRNLTLNLGLRFDHDAPYNERYGRTTNGFLTNVDSPISAAALANYAKAPIPQIPVGQFAVKGGLSYPTGGDRAVYQTTSKAFSPRIGVAWTPGKLGGRTVIRAGFGAFVSPISIASLSISGSYSTTPILTQQGFSQSTTMSPSNDNFLTPFATLANPFPNNSIRQPAGNSGGLATFLGQTINYLNPNIKNPFSQRWNFGFQHSLGRSTVLEVVYIGNRGGNIPLVFTQMNVVPRQYLSTQGTRDQALITALTASNPNPFVNLLPGSNINGATVSVAQLLSKYPQYPTGTGSGSAGIIQQNANLGSSYFHSVNVRLARRFSNGLMFTTNFIKSKMMERATWLNDTDAEPEKRVSPFDRSNRITMATNYELPFGKGRRFGIQNKVLNAIAGGWSWSFMYQFQSGAPLSWVNGSTTTTGDYVYFGDKVNLSNRETNGPAFNTSAFNTVAANQFQYHVRTFSTTFGNLRADGVNQTDTSLLKRIYFTEKIYFQLRAEAYNFINHPTFAAPNTTATNSQFGVITAQSNRPRTMMFGGRIVF